MRPYTLRPPVLGLGASRDFSGLDLVISTKSETEAPRRPGEVGLYLRIPMSAALEDLDLVFRVQRHQRPLGGLALTDDHACPLALALADQGVHVLHPDREDRLDGFLDLGLVGVGMHDEGVGVAIQQPVALLADHGLEDDVARVFHAPASSSAAGCSSRTSSSSSGSATVLRAGGTRPAAPEPAASAGACVLPRPVNASSAPRVNATTSEYSTS